MYDEETIEANYPRQDGLNIASQFYSHAPDEDACPSEEKSTLLRNWKTEQIHKLFGHFQENLSRALQAESSPVVEEVASFVKTNSQVLKEGKSFDYIPTALTRLGWRSSDRDALFDFLEERLCQDKLVSCISRLEFCHTTDVEGMKRHIVSSIIESMKPSFDMKKSQERSLPYQVLAEGYRESKNKHRPIVVMIEELGRASPEGLAFLFPLLKASLKDMPVILILGCCSNSLSLNHLLPSKVLDCLAVRSITCKSPKTVLDSILSDVLVQKPLFSFKFGPSALKLLQDNFMFYNISLEKLLSIVKLMIMNHFRLNDMSILCAVSLDDLQDILRGLSKNEVSSLRSLVKTLPSMSGQSIPESDTQFKFFLKESLQTLDDVHSEFLACIRYLDMLSSDLEVESRGVSLTCCLIQALRSKEDMTCDQEFKDAVTFLQSLSIDDLMKTLEFCVNNNPVTDMHAGSDCLSSSQAMHRLVSEKLKQLKELDKELNIEMQALTSSKKMSLTDSSNLNNSLNNSKQNNKSINLSGLKSRQEWKERLKEQILSSSSSSKSSTSISKFELFKKDFVNDLKSILQELRSPLNLPLSEAVYFDDAASIAENYYPCLRKNILDSLRSSDKSNETLGISRVYETLSGASASVSLHSLLNGFGCKKPIGKKRYSRQTVSPKKKNRKSRKQLDDESSEDEEETKGMKGVDESQFFTLINDMEYIGLIEKSDKKKAGHITKLVWE